MGGKNKITIKFVETQDKDFDFGNLRNDLPGLYEMDVDADFWREYVSVRERYEKMHGELVERVLDKKVRKFNPGIPVQKGEQNG